MGYESFKLALEKFNVKLINKKIINFMDLWKTIKLKYIWYFLNNLFFPLFLFLIFVTYGILLTMGYPIFYTRKIRINGKKFNIIKFRTMINNNLSDLKVNKIWKFLRSR